MRLADLFGLTALASTLALGAACGGKTDGADAPSDGGGDCRPGDKKRMDCNSCTCDPSGFWSCGIMGCVDASPDVGCTLGATRKVDCNTCTCTSYGWSCTEMACADAGTDTATDTATDASLDPRCPTTWAAANAIPHDELCGDGIACGYPEGSCTCPSYCGGPPPGPDWKPSWSCTPKRTDGCPEAELTDGAACAVGGKVCSYGSCCMTQYECVAGKWKGSGPICPP